MKIEHIAMYVNDLEGTRDFFVKYLGGLSNDGYHNELTGFRSYFITFDDGARLEIMNKPSMEEHLKDCRDALCRSTLGDRYFSSQGSAEEAILEGIRQENLYVAFIGEECVGFTYIIPKGAFHSFPYLHIIAVKEEYRNKGIGKALLDYSENIACEMADKLFLVVADYNPDAKRFYERNGYQQVGKIPNLYRPGITEYMMAKDLNKK